MFADYTDWFFTVCPKIPVFTDNMHIFFLSEAILPRKRFWYLGKNHAMANGGGWLSTAVTFIIAISNNGIFLHIWNSISLNVFTHSLSILLLIDKFCYSSYRFHHQIWIVYAWLLGLFESKLFVYVSKYMMSSVKRKVITE